MASEQDLQMEYEYAQAKAKAEAEQTSNQEAEINARGPVNTSGSPDDRQAVSDTQYHYRNLDDAHNNAMNELRGLGKGVANAGLGALQTANAVGGFIGNKLGEGYDKIASTGPAQAIGLSPRSPERVQSGKDFGNKEQKAFQDATFQETTSADKWAMPAGQIGANVIAAGGVGKAVAGLAKPIVGRVGGYLAGAAAGGATAAASFPQQEGLLIRHDGYVGFDINPTDDAATQQTKKFLNQSLDNMALGVVGDGVFTGLKKTGEIVKTIYKGFADHGNMNALQQQAAEDVLSVYGQLGEHPTPAQQRKAAEEVTALIDKNGVQNYDFGSGGKKSVKKDTISTLTSDLNSSNPVDSAIETKLEALRASAKRGNAPKTQVQLEQPNNVLDQGLADIQSSAGGPAAVDQTRTALQDAAQTRAAAADVPVQQAKTDIATKQADYTDALRKDPAFSPALDQADKNGIKLNVNQLENDKKSAILNAVKDIRASDASVRNAAYDKVSETGVQYGPKLWGDAVQKADKYIPQHIKDLIEQSDGSFGYLNNEIRPRISDAITDLRKANRPENYDAINSLMELRDNITDKQIDYIKKKAGGSATARLADEATQENVRYSNKYNQGIGNELKMNEKNFSPKTKPIDFIEKGRPIVDNAVGSPNRDLSIQQLKGILGPQEGLVADTAMLKATKDIQAGKGANFDKITSDLQQMGHNFSPTQQARLEGFLNDVKSQKMSIEDLQSKLPDLEAASKQEKDDIFLKDFPNMFEPVAGKKVPNENGYKVFNDAMNNEQPRVIQALTQRATETGKLDGLKSAWAKSAGEQINSSSKQVGKLSDQFLKSGETIFGKNAPEVTAVKTLRDYSDKLEKSLNKPGLEGLNATENQKNLRTTISLVQTWVFGVLNPTAARINKITSQLAEKYNSTEVAHQAIDNILSDNQEMKKAMQALINKTQSQLDPETWKKLYASAARFGLYQVRPTSQLKFQTDQAISK